MNPVNHLNNTVWATLKPSPINGVGVFAIRDIPRGTLITDYSVHNITNIVSHRLTKEELDELVPEIKDLILDRTVFQEGQKVFNIYSPNYEQTLRSFMNHSDQPNTDGERTLVDIKKGEELTEDYGEMGTPHEMTKKHYSFVYGNS